VLPLPGLDVAEFDSAVRVVPFPIHKTRKPIAEITAERGSAIIRTLVANDMEPAAARMIVQAEPLPQVPVMLTDAEAEAFMAKDLSDLDWSQFKPMNFDDGA
jgi:hypothetical protein